MTPGVVAVGLVCATVMVLGVTAAVAYLSVRGLDPDPMLRLVAELGALVSGVGSLALQLVQRRTVAKVERNTGLLAAGGCAECGTAPASVREEEPAQVPLPPDQPRPPVPASVRRPLTTGERSGRHASGGDDTRPHQLIL